MHVYWARHLTDVQTSFRTILRERADRMLSQMDGDLTVICWRRECCTRRTGVCGYHIVRRAKLI